MTGYGDGAYGSGPYGGDTTPGRLPTVHVLLDDGTGTFPHDLTNMSGVSYVLLGDGVKYDRGRQDWQGGVTAATASLTLNNSDGRFTVGSTIIATPSPIKVDQRIRITETVNGTTFTRFTGYVKQWPVTWPATVSTFATAQIVASDAQARAERQVLRSIVEQEIAQDAPTVYFTMAEPAEAVAAGDTSGNQANPMVQAGSGAAVTFGATAGPATAGALTVATFSGGMHLQTVGLSTGSTPGYLFAFATTSTTSAEIFVAEPDISKSCSLQIDASGGLKLGSTTVGSGGYNNGAWHVVGLRMTGALTTDVYIDGVLTNSGVTTTTSPAGQQICLGAERAGNNPFTGSIAHFAVWSTAPTGARMIADSQAILTGFAGESNTARIDRLAAYANLSLGTFDASLTNVPFVDITGRSVWDALQEVADAGLGIVFIDGSGSLTFRNRNHVTSKTSPDLTLGASYVTPDVQPVHDDQQILNYIEAVAAGTQVTQVVRSAASEALHGRYADSKTYLVQTDGEALDRANWILSNFAEPTTRYGTLTINLYAMSAASAALVLAALEIGSWIQVTDMPSQNTGGATVDLVVEGYTEQATASSWSITLNVVSKYLFDALILDDPTRGLLDAGNRLYV